MTQETPNQENELWFLRHGRAGIENEYDALSEEGFCQANAFGQYCQEMQIEFDSVYVGSLRRQQETATTVADRLSNFTPEQIITHQSLNEFSPHHVVRVISKLRETNIEIRAIVDEWMLKWNESVDAGKPMFHKIMEYFLEAWVDETGEHGFDSWANSVIEGFSLLPNQGRVLVVSSATPIAIASGIAFGMSPKQSLQLAEPIFNSSLTIIKRRQPGYSRNGLEPIMFNAIPHLRDAKLVTLL